MRKSIFIISFLCTSVVGFTQTGIGTALPHPSAVLEVFAGDKGVLLPRVQLASDTDATTIVTGNEVSLLVYNTGSEKTETHEGLPKGFYYWTGDRWTKIINSDDSSSIVAGNETLTTLEIQESASTQVEGETEEEQAENQRKLYALVYNDEKGMATEIDINGLVKKTESITSLAYDPTTHVLTYINEDEEELEFGLRDLVGDSESLTLLSFNESERELLYTDEEGYVNHIDLRSLVKSPWLDTEKHEVAVEYGDNIYTDGWVGIGFSSPSDAPSEKLRVNGSITAVNSYYADYVFEEYYDGASALKSDYEFKRLNAVEDFIITNRHLPGITPVSELLKSEEGYSFNVSELSIQLLEKTEELYLHIIEQHKKIEEKERMIETLHQKTDNLSNKIKALETRLLNIESKNESL